MSTKRISLVEIFIWLFVVILLVLVISPFGLGFKIKNDYTLLSQKLSDMMQVDISIVEYDRGFFSSDVIVEMQFPGLPSSLQFKENIIHGPVYLGLVNQGKSPFVAAVVKGQLLPVEGFESVIDQFFPGQSAMVYQNIIDFAGNLSTEGYIPAVNAVLEQESATLEIKSTSVFMNSYYSAMDEKLTGENTLSKFSLAVEDKLFSLSDLNISFSGKLGENNLLIGDSVLSLDKLNIESDIDQFSLSNFSVSSVTSEAGSLLNSQFRVDIQEMLLSNQKLGPIIFALSVNGLDAVSINKITELQRTIEEKIQQGVPQEQANAMLMGEMVALIPELFRQAVITIDPLSLHSELGKLEASVDLSVDGLDQNTPADPMFLLTAINLDMDMSADEALLKQLVDWQLTANADQLMATGNDRSRKAEASVSMSQKVDENLKGLIDENWLIYADGKYSSRITLQQGMMTINNKQVDPMAQIMSQMGGSDASAP